MKNFFFASVLLSSLTLTGMSNQAPAPSAPGESQLLQHQSVGESVRGSETMADAGELPVGASQDLLPVTGTEAAYYYQLPVIEEGENVHVSAQLIVDPMNQATSRESIELRGQLVTADGKQCTPSDGARVSRDGFDRPALVLASTGVKRAEGFGSCLSQGNDQVYFKLGRDGLWQADTEIPVELRVVVEPAVDPTTLSGQIPDKLPPVSVSLNAPANPVTGGSGFSNATELADQSVSSDAVLPFEVKYYRVHVAEGQRLNYRLSVGDSREASAQRLVTRTFSPLLADQVVERDSAALAREDVGASVTRSTLSEVSRDLVDSHGGQTWLRTPGSYYITVTGAARDPRGLTPLEYELAVELTGEPRSTDAWMPGVDLTAKENGPLGLDVATATGWLPSGAQLGALLGGVAVALAGIAGLRLLRRKKRA